MQIKTTEEDFSVPHKIIQILKHPHYLLHSLMFLSTSYIPYTFSKFRYWDSMEILIIQLYKFISPDSYLFFSVLGFNPGPHACQARAWPLSYILIPNLHLYLTLHFPKISFLKLDCSKSFSMKKRKRNSRPGNKLHEQISWNMIELYLLGENGEVWGG
jgi:hypothetical protein